MRDFNGKIKAVSRRIAHLRSRVTDNNVSEKSAAYDRAEVTALSDLLRVAAVYNDARGPEGSHVENTLYMVQDVISTTLASTQDAPTKERLQEAWNRCSESLRVIRKMADDEKT